ncbi:TetR/AcrR family transcriptional regulator [Dactylosporangium darangshiense]|uniref:TetR/AcrR family transcriptional regulator n=1 Tax=Dactylosporangium darangshiense TaxID=579108 RepID=A0ABP8DQM1_9ACTN
MADHGRDRAYEDLTARARIRDAAIRLFAERGINGTTVRDIAQLAGVSPGLLRHHFGSKEALHDACDAYVLERAIEIKEKLVFGGEIANPGFLPAAHPEILLTYRYVTRALLDGSTTAAAMFDDLVARTEDWIGTHMPDITEDHRAFAAVLVGMQSGLAAMNEHVSRALGVDVFTPEGHLRMAAALAALYSHPLLDPDFVAQTKGALERVRASNPSTAPANDAGAEGA